MSRAKRRREMREAGYHRSPKKDGRRPGLRAAQVEEGTDARIVESRPLVRLENGLYVVRDQIVKGG